MSVRIDKWLWAVRVFKTRSDAAEACRAGRVTLRGGAAKPSAEVRPDDRVTVRRGPVTYVYRVVEAVTTRRPAAEAALYAENLTPPQELAKLAAPRETMFMVRERGAGRPTKRDRRLIDAASAAFGSDPDAADDTGD